MGNPLTILSNKVRFLVLRYVS